MIPKNFDQFCIFFLGSNDAEKLAKTLNDSSLNFKYSTLEKATASFDEANKLGQGGFGTVYKVSTQRHGQFTAYFLNLQKLALSYQISILLDRI